MEEDKDRFCAICERKLSESDSEHVCRSCFRKAREPKEISVEMSEQAAQNMGLAFAFGNLFNWGIQKLVEMCEKSKGDDKTFDAPLV